MLHVLSDGTRVRIRPIEAGDGPRLAAGLAALSDETVRRRFLVAKPAFSPSELRYLTQVDGVGHLALVAVLDEDPERLAGVARCVRLAPGADTAEFAIVIADHQQSLGLGRLLGRSLADAARAAGIRRFTAVTLADNVAIAHLMRSFSTRVEHRAGQGGLRELVAVLPDGGPRAPLARTAA